MQALVHEHAHRERAQRDERPGRPPRRAVGEGAPAPQQAERDGEEGEHGQGSRERPRVGCGERGGSVLGTRVLRHSHSIVAGGFDDTS